MEEGNFKYREVIETNMEVEMLERKVDLILEKLERIEEFLFIEEDEPLEDELEAIKRYLQKKREGKLDLVSLEEALNEV